MTEKNITLTLPEEHPDFLRCMDYIMCREVGTMSVKDFAEKHGVDERTVYRWQNKWLADGLLQKCRKAIIQPAIQEVAATNNKVVAEWPAIAKNLVEIAKGEGGASPYVAVNAAQWLYEKVVVPAVEAGELKGHEEAEYLESKASSKNPFNPMAISE